MATGSNDKIIHAVRPSAAMRKRRKVPREILDARNAMERAIREARAYQYAKLVERREPIFSR